MKHLSCAYIKYFTFVHMLRKTSPICSRIPQMYHHITAAFSSLVYSSPNSPTRIYYTMHAFYFEKQSNFIKISFPILHALLSL